MSTLTRHPRTAATRPLRSLLLLVAAIVVAVIADSIVVSVALVAGANPEMGALSPMTYGTLTAILLVIAYAGWRIVRRFASAPRRLLRVLVPVLLAVSWVPDVVVGTSGEMAGVTTTGIVALMCMHVVAVLVAVPTFQRIAPV